MNTHLRLLAATAAATIALGVGATATAHATTTADATASATPRHHDANDTGITPTAALLVFMSGSTALVVRRRLA